MPKAAKQYWLMKCEPGAYSITDLEKDKKTLWEGVRNYQARNFMRDQMRVGDEALFYHSNATPPGVAGLARILRTGLPDPEAWNPKSPYHDPKATLENPIWAAVEIAFVAKFSALIPLETLRIHPGLQGMLVLARGQRLSVQPVEVGHFKIIMSLAAKIKSTR